MQTGRPSPAARVLRHILTGVAIVLLPTSCGTGYQAPPVTPQFTKVSRTPLSQMERGHAVHQAKCAKCHAFEDPANYSTDELSRDIMPEMAEKAKLDSADESAVLAYLLAARNLPPQDAPLKSPGT